MHNTKTISQHISFFVHEKENLSLQKKENAKARSYIKCLPIIFSFLWTDVVVIIVVVVGGSVVCNVACGISGEI